MMIFSWASSVTTTSGPLRLRSHCSVPTGPEPPGGWESGTEGPGGSSSRALRAGPAAASSSPPQLTLLVMQPCSGDEEAAGGIGRHRGPAQAPETSGGLVFLCEVCPSEGEGDAAEEGEPAGGESTASPEELEDEEAAAASGGEGPAGGEGCKSCTYQGCSETTTQVAKQRKPWMCKRHRNKMYKDKYKRKKSDQALGGAGAPPAQGGAATPGGSARAEDCVEGSVSVTKQRTGSIGDRPARPTLLEQVLNQKRLSLLRSPEVVQFLQKQQQLLSQQALEQRQQQQFPGAPV
ncbi:regulatory factor X-associated protein-like [Terrapene carolina triunguis]|uniref:regulatory factor X-associated protein-like n=1 Tax=Terrapene triunguis TaxID=2587831 RepID=UPI000E77F46F|nr:regulatory factor X-associated protein-like [Terrapene carolina triunguis]